MNTIQMAIALTRNGKYTVSVADYTKLSLGDVDRSGVYSFDSLQEVFEFADGLFPKGTD